MSPRRLIPSLVLLVFVAHGWFAGAVGWNQLARIAATFAFVEESPHRFTFRIDDWVQPGPRRFSTLDWARGADGHYYSNKAPGVSMIGVPAYAAIYAVEDLFDVDPRVSRPLTQKNFTLLNLWSTVMFTAFGTGVLFWFLSAHAFTPRDALIVALAYAFGTLVFPYDTSIWGHATGAAFVLMSFCLVFRPDAARFAMRAGLCAGMAVLIEYGAVFALAAIAAAHLAPGYSWRQRLRFGAGAAVPLSVLLLYQKLAFGGFLVTATAQQNPEFLDTSRAMGILGPMDLSVLWQLTFSAYRGLFTFCPVLLFAGVGAWHAWRDGRRAMVVCALGGFVATLLLITTFNGWWGGWCTGPRYLVIVTPLLAVLLPAPSRLAPSVRLAFYAALAVSVLNMLLVTTVEVMIPETERNPLYGFVYSHALAGQYPTTGGHRNVPLSLLHLPQRWDIALFVVVFGAWALWLLRRATAAAIRR